jgi:hypothetical protein
MPGLAHDAPLRFSCSSSTCHETCAQRVTRKGVDGQACPVCVSLHHGRDGMPRQPRQSYGASLADRSEHGTVCDATGMEPGAHIAVTGRVSACTRQGWSCWPVSWSRAGITL